jgi:hypothetical protein
VIIEIRNENQRKKWTAIEQVIIKRKSNHQEKRKRRPKVFDQSRLFELKRIEICSKSFQVREGSFIIQNWTPYRRRSLDGFVLSLLCSPRAHTHLNGTRWTNILKGAEKPETTEADKEILFCFSDLQVVSIQRFEWFSDIQDFQLVFLSDASAFGWPGEIIVINHLEFSYLSVLFPERRLNLHTKSLVISDNCWQVYISFRLKRALSPLLRAHRWNKWIKSLKYVWPFEFLSSATLTNTVESSRALVLRYHSWQASRIIARPHRWRQVGESVCFRDQEAETEMKSGAIKYSLSPHAQMLSCAIQLEKQFQWSAIPLRMSECLSQRMWWCTSYFHAIAESPYVWLIQQISRDSQCWSNNIRNRNQLPKFTSGSAVILEWLVVLVLKVQWINNRCVIDSLAVWSSWRLTATRSAWRRYRATMSPATVWRGMTGMSGMSGMTGMTDATGFVRRILWSRLLSEAALRWFWTLSIIPGRI